MPLKEVGRSSVRFRECAATPDSAAVRIARETFPELGELAWPERGSAAELASLALQAGKHIKTPAPEGLIQACDRLLEKYPKAPVDPVLRSWDPVELKRRIEELCKYSLKRDASPGVPLAAIATTNADLIDNHLAMMVDIVYERLMLLASDVDLSSATAVQLLELGVVDPVRLFVKQEPHKRSKMKEKRFRLISSVSAVDQVIERLLFGPQNSLEIDNWHQIPSKPGMGLSLDRQARVLYADVAMKHQRRPAVCADISGFDWSVQEWEFEAEMYMRMKLMEPSLEGNSRLNNAVRNRFLAFSLSVFQLSDGTLIAQIEPGIMKSGSYLTSSMNSRVRCLMAELIGSPWCIAMGDDSVEGWVEDAPLKYAGLGHICKDYQPCPVGFAGELKSFDFCSHYIDQNLAYLLTWPRTLYRYLSSKDPNFADLSAELGNSPKWASIHAYLRRLDGSPTKELG